MCYASVFVMKLFCYVRKYFLEIKNSNMCGVVCVVEAVTRKRSHTTQKFFSVNLVILMAVWRSGIVVGCLDEVAVR